jgi:hypothetical protein
MPKMYDEPELLDSQTLDDRVHSLIALQTQRRWYFVIFLWLTIGVASVWSVRSDIALWLEFFTWSAVRQSLRNQPLAYFGFGFSVAMTLSTLMRQSWNILRGITKQEYQELVKQVYELEERNKKYGEKS